MACRLEEIPEVGDWVEYKILNDSVIIVRTRSGVKAFHNACRHRGMRLASNHGNCADNGFICPFHGWRFNMDGENTFVFGRKIFSEENLEKARSESGALPARDSGAAAPSSTSTTTRRRCSNVWGPWRSGWMGGTSTS